MKICQKNLRATALLNLVKANTLIISLYFFCGCARDYIPEKIYLPKNYIGWVYIIHNQENGTKEKDGRFRVYHVPDNGIVFTQYEINQGWVKENSIQIYEEVSSGKYRQIPNEIDFIMDSTFKEANKNIIFGFPSTPQSCGVYSIYSLSIDTLKNWNKYNGGVIELSEHQIDSLKSNNNVK